MKMAIPAALCLGLAAIPAEARDCAADALDVAQIDGLAYDPADATAGLVRIAIRGVAPIRAECAQVDLSVRPRAGGGRIELRSGGRILRAHAVRSALLGSASPVEIRLAPSAPGDLVRQGRIDLDMLEIDAGQFVPPGDYVAELELVAGDRPPRPFEIKVRVAPALRLVGDSVRRLSLGEVSSGAEARSTFAYATNATIRVTPRSEHRGHLQHEGGATIGRLPYAAYLSGAPLDLGAGAPITLGSGASRLRMEELRVRIEPQRQAFAGTYRDTLTLDFLAY